MRLMPEFLSLARVVQQNALQSRGTKLNTRRWRNAGAGFLLRLPPGRIRFHFVGGVDEDEAAPLNRWHQGQGLGVAALEVAGDAFITGHLAAQQFYVFGV